MSLVEDVEQKPSRRAPSPFNALTATQFEVLQSIAIGKLNKTIAYECNVSEGTIKTHTSVLLKKTGCAGRNHLILWYLARLTPEALHEHLREFGPAPVQN